MKIGIFGGSGRMGQELQKILLNNPQKYTQIEIFSRAQKPTQNVLKNLDCLIDFSLPEAFDEVLAIAKASQIPLVSGTTGISFEQKKALADLSQYIPVLYSANMSIGIAVLAKALSALGNIKEYDFHIEEIHHKQKIDSPSGTANLLKDKLDQVIQKKSPTPVSIRGGGIFGIHRVWVMGPSETLCFEHQALNRTVFAEGALRAAEWLCGIDKPNSSKKAKGLYSFTDMLDL
jgi:4-hydroxy-tetrahydrodipicolinate reductase